MEEEKKNIESETVFPKENVAELTKQPEMDEGISFPVMDDSSENTIEGTEKQKNNSEQSFCTRCGMSLLPDQLYCPSCGQKVGVQIVPEILAPPNSQATPTKGKNTKYIALIAGIAAALLAVIAIIFILRGVQAKSITLNKKELVVKVGEDSQLTYTINPSNTKNKTANWASSNESIAQVTDGVITGINEGDCTITVSTRNGKTDTCSITVLPAGPDLKALFNDYCSSAYATVASDGSYLSIDTNPDDKDDHFEYIAYMEIQSVLEALELPESVLNRMGQTRAMDGIQSYNTDDLEITWTYHPDKGLEVVFSKK